ncbi:uncharacterized protein Osi23 isoform X1 [Tribolium castaneum]|uniref:uncharacterized protein Osi23 isoform X1 n=1 Tax=Tribolium castaneum TaxID=7070 RepID=UPI00077DA57D|nr:PREDICTED: uncharacterized protein LOC107399291 [Tribolium castaneum]|eukprot:XP_015840940.1 PREDICTED: uncharacterized protein LOC107399291 [Tribolium castaneum]
MSASQPRLIGLVVLLLSIVSRDKFITTSNKTENIWKKAGRVTGLLLQNCMQHDGPQEQFLLILQRCLKRRSLLALDRSLKADVIELASGIELVKYRQENDTTQLRQFSDWKHEMLKRLTQLLDTHVLKIRLNGQFIEARGKKKQNMFMSLLMFGIAAVGLIMVPMGFQFLAVLGGKALLLAKMALILTAIQGLKKIATSNLNYGLYAAPPEHHHGHCKDGFCDEFKSLEADDSVFVEVDVDQLASNFGFWHYDRQWPYEAESSDVAPSYSHYYKVPDQHPNLLHALQPREDSIRNIM